MNAVKRLTATIRAGPAPNRAPDQDAIRAYFSQTQDDYRRWSNNWNMHFGYWARGMNPFDREAMVERMNVEASDALALDPAAPAKIVDLGCGTGATARSIARRYKRVEITGVTIVHEQIQLGAKLNREAGLARRIGFVLSDYADTWLGDASQDAAIAIESFCYAPGAGKFAALREAARVLKPGAPLVVVDGFLARETPRGVLGWIYRRWCAGWSIPELATLDEFKRSLRAAGFVDVEVRDIFWNVAVSAAHIPWVASTHTVRELWTNRGRLSAWRWRHIGASWLSLLLGLAKGTFRYCIVTARKQP
jgi:cyclopropane fatty-acyl-phospholipid synthase-like methyltransferase